MYNRVEALKQAVTDGTPAIAMIAADFFLLKGKITQAEFDEIEGLVYPAEVEVVEGD